MLDIDTRTPSTITSHRPRAQAEPVCANGSWNYRDHTGTSRTAADFTVEAWDDDTGSNDPSASGVLRDL